MTTLYSNPDTVPLSVKDAITWGFDFTNYLTSYPTPVPTVTAGTATLTNKMTGVDASSALGGFSTASPKVGFKITASGLTVNADYLLIVTATLSNGDTVATETLVKVQA